MTDAPEKIWAIADRRKHWDTEKPTGPNGLHAVEYTRADAQCVEVKELEWGKHPDEQEWYSKLPEIEGETFERGYMILPSRSHFTLYDGFLGRSRVLGHFTLARDAKAAAQAHHAAQITAAINTRTVAEVRREGYLAGLDAAREICDDRANLLDEYGVELECCVGTANNCRDDIDAIRALGEGN